MPETMLILGGCRSGKSGFALKQACQYTDHSWKYVATCVPFDQEMQVRVSQHQRQRGDEWMTLEEPLYLPELLEKHNRKKDLLLVDCLTMWVNNLLMEDMEEEQVMQEFSKLKIVLQSSRATILLVSNEVGAGLVPETPLTRKYRDYVGTLNQWTASEVQQVYWMVAGIAVRVK